MPSTQTWALWRQNATRIATDGPSPARGRGWMLLRRPETREMQADARVALATRLVSTASLRRRLRPTLPARRVTRTGPASRLEGVELTSAGLRVAGVTGAQGLRRARRSRRRWTQTAAQWQMVRLDVGAWWMHDGGRLARGGAPRARGGAGGNGRDGEGCGAREAAALRPRLRGRARGGDASRQVGVCGAHDVTTLHAVK